MQLQKIQNRKTITKTIEEHSEKELIDFCNERHVMPSDLRLYKGEISQQDYDDMKSVSVSSEAQKNWARKHFQINENENCESAMMCWKSLEDSEQEEWMRKMIVGDKEMNGDKEKEDDEKDNEEHAESTVHTENQLKIPVKELKLGVDGNALTLATQET